MAEKKKRGAKSKYKPELCEIVKERAAEGATNKDLAKACGVNSPVTIYNWAKANPEFLNAIKEGKFAADDAVEVSLFQRATGFSHPETKFFCHEGCIITEETTKHYPPDTAAAKFWLTNRRPEEWRDKQDIEMSGKLTTENLSDEEVERRYAELKAKIESES